MPIPIRAPRRFAGLVNAVLRGLSRDKETALPAELAKGDEAPEWFRDRLVRAYGAEKAAAILAAHRVEAPTDFTVKSDPERWAERFGGIVLPTGSVRVERLAGPSRSFLASPRASGGSRMRRPAFRRACSATLQAKELPTSAPHPAAKRLSSRWRAPP